MRPASTFLGGRERSRGSERRRPRGGRRSHGETLESKDREDVSMMGQSGMGGKGRRLKSRFLSSRRGWGEGVLHPQMCHCHQTARCCVCPVKHPSPLNRVLLLNAFPGRPAPTPAISGTGANEGDGVPERLTSWQKQGPLCCDDKSRSAPLPAPAQSVLNAQALRGSSGRPGRRREGGGLPPGGAYNLNAP